MRNKQTLIIVVLMLVTLSGVIFVQLVWMNRAVEENRHKFDMEVTQAIRETVDKLARKEEVIFLSKRVDFNTERNIVQITRPDSVMTTEIVYVSKQGIDSDSSIVVSPESISHTFNFQNIESVEGSDSVNLSITANSQSDKINDFAGIIGDMVVEFEANKKPIEERISREDIEVQLSKSLERHNIQLAYDFAVFAQQDSLIQVLSSKEMQADDAAYTAQLFPDDKNSRGYQLSVQFESRNAYIFHSLNGLLIFGLIFTLALISTFVYTLSVLIRQKKISQIKTDFINNMTHEFKTPITTIAVAVDSLSNEIVRNNPEKQDYFTSVIRKENKKMNQRIEQVLKLSVDDQSVQNIDIVMLDVALLIRECCDSFQVQISHLSGRLKFSNMAENTVLWADVNQIRTLLCNLLDNAVKYSDEAPKIELRLCNVDENIRIEVIDHGIGISAREQQKIFDRFYRVHTGNIHAVKGFGLGLSQVKAIVDSYHGEIKLKSEIGNGSQFIVVLPRNPKINE